MICRLCDSQAGREHLAREMMFGLRETFHYFECAGCGAVQLATPPDDLSRYYPAEDYYAFTPVDSAERPRNPLRRWVKRQRDAAVLFGGNRLTRWLARRWPNPGIDDIRRWLSRSSVHSWRARILDIGCGQGRLLFRLAALGFTGLVGVDPYCRESVQTKSVTILKQSLESLALPPFDLVMLHHSLEHMPDQIGVLTRVRNLLSPQGVCLARIPIASRGPWERYGTDWVELDAPRHFCLHTELSLSLAAARAGLSIRQIDYEADAFFYRASEMYRRDIPLRSVDDPAQCFSAAELAEFERLARRYNVPGWAGRAAFYLQRAEAASTLSVSLTG